MLAKSQAGMTTKKLSKGLKWTIRGLPLAGAVTTAFLPLHRFGQQFGVLIVLLWMQVFFILEIFMAGK